MDTMRVRAQIHAAAKHLDESWIDPACHSGPSSKAVRQFLAALFIGAAHAHRHFEDGAWWQADHVVPVVEGGGGCGLDGLRTLCTLCHLAETKALARRRAERRRL